MSLKNIEIIHGDNGPEICIKERYPVLQSRPLSENDSWLRGELTQPGFIRFDKNHVLGRNKNGEYTVYVF